MLKKAALFLIILTCFATKHVLISHELTADNIIVLSEKIYIEVDQINFMDKKIYVHVNEGIFEIPAIYSDENGYFFDKVAKSGHCSWYEWECLWRPCGYCNLRGIDLKCRACGRDMSGNK